MRLRQLSFYHFQIFQDAQATCKTFVYGGVVKPERLPGLKYQNLFAQPGSLHSQRPFPVGRIDNKGRCKQFSKLQIAGIIKYAAQLRVVVYSRTPGMEINSKINHWNNVVHNVMSNPAAERTAFTPRKTTVEVPPIRQIALTEKKGHNIKYGYGNDCSAERFCDCRMFEELADDFNAV